MKKQKINNRRLISKITARVMLIILVLTSALSLSGCYFGPTIAYNWEVHTHDEFVTEIEKFNSVNDGFVNTFISFDFDENKNISKTIYRFDTAANKSAVNDIGLCDKICNFFDIDIIYYLREKGKNDEVLDYAYQIACYYRDVQYTFSESDKIEIKEGFTQKGEKLDMANCSYRGTDISYLKILYEKESGDDLYVSKMVYDTYKSAYHYEIFINDIKFACLHISSIEEASEEKLEEIVQMFMVILNTEE